MRDFEVGDMLFGYPITKLSADYVEITVPNSGIQFSFDRAQFDEGARYALSLAGSWVMHS